MPPTVSGTTYEMRSRINSINPYASTYTYLKYCKNYIMGYGMHGVQILKRECLYGGIRDFSAAIKTQQQSTVNLNKTIRMWGQAYKDLGNQVFGELYKDSGDLGGILKGKAKEIESDFIKIIRGWATDQKDLEGYLKQASAGQDDLSAFLKPNFREYLDLNTRLKGWVIEAQRDLGSYTKSVIASTKDINKFIQPLHISDLNQTIGLIPAQDLQIIIQHNDRVVNLFGTIRAKYYVSIGGIIRCKYIYDLPTLLMPIEPVDLSASLEPILHINLGAAIDGWYGPIKNLLNYINAVPAQDLPTSIIGWGGYRIPIDLPTLIQSYQESDLSAYVDIIPHQNLGATLIPKGQIYDLGAHITPKVVYFRSIINVALLEHKDLQAMINYACFYSDWRSLSASLYCFSKKDLPVNIWGTLQNASSTYKDLSAYINVHSYYTQDKIPVEFHTLPEVDPYTFVNINYDVVGVKYNVFNTIPLYYYGQWPKDLGVSINGVYHTRDLSARIVPNFDFSYSELPPWINPRTYEVVLDIRKLSLYARRFVEIMFDAIGESPYHYFYVGAEQKIYRVDRGRHWSIKTVGYTKVENAEVDRVDVREKQTFDLSNYSTIDEAVRSLIDRAANYMRVNLPTSIMGVPPPHRDLPVNLYAYKIRSWTKNLKIIMQPLRIRDFVLAVKSGYEGTYDLHSQVYKILQRSDVDLNNFIRMWDFGNYDIRCTVRWYKGVSDFTGYVKQAYYSYKDLDDCLIVPRQYEAQGPDNIVFNFENDGYVATTASGIEFNFTSDDLVWTHPEYETPKYNTVRVTRSSIEILRKET